MARNLTPEDARKMQAMRGRRGREARSASIITIEAAKSAIVRVVNDNAVSIIRAVVRKALKGNVSAAREAFDRAYGRTIEMQKDGDKVTIRIDV